MTTITKLHARQIFDSRGNPTVEVDLTTSKGMDALGLSLKHIDSYISHLIFLFSSLRCHSRGI